MPVTKTKKWYLLILTKGAITWFIKNCDGSVAFYPI